jgi:hypothetical protein
MPATAAPIPASPPAVQAAMSLARESRLLASTASILGWDQETMMPPGGLEHRARQLAQLARQPIPGSAMRCRPRRPRWPRCPRRIPTA